MKYLNKSFSVYIHNENYEKIFKTNLSKNKENMDNKSSDSCKTGKENIQEKTRKGEIKKGD